jgi:hypothetical protein
MNRSILIVICDFLLVSLLAFSTVDINKATDATSPREIRVDLSTNNVESGKDLAAVMRLALEEERKNRDLLMGELSKSREAFDRQESALKDRERQVQGYQQQLQSREQEAAKLQQQQAALQQEYATTQTNLQNLNMQLQTTTADFRSSRDRVVTLEADLRKQAEQAAALQQQLARLSASNQMVLEEKQKLSAQLQVAEVERKHASNEVARMQQEVKVEREEKARLTQQATKLAEGVSALANKSGELAQEIRENRPMTPNMIFDEFLTNRVMAKIKASRSGLFLNNKERDTETVLASDGTNIFAICHVTETPLTFMNPGTEWEGLVGTLSHGRATVAIPALNFCWPDPRVVLIPVSPADAKQLGSKIYRTSAAPFKFQDAVLVGAKEGYYGECRFQIDPTAPGYVRLDNSFIRGLFGKFNPSRGDLVFSKSGELLGVMANGTYCVMVQNFESTATIKFGENIKPQKPGDMLSRLYAFVAGMPLKLQ